MDIANLIFAILAAVIAGTGVAVTIKLARDKRRRDLIEALRGRLATAYDRTYDALLTFNVALDWRDRRVWPRNDRARATAAAAAQRLVEFVEESRGSIEELFPASTAAEVRRIARDLEVWQAAMPDNYEPRDQETFQARSRKIAETVTYFDAELSPSLKALDQELTTRLRGMHALDAPPELP